ncbi:MULTISPECIES: cytochrome c oxidase accessory protein CcoG [unclassified Undibacterium]|uniref:cytochrome c oxidase accessory protein CcoG n=1 Tax=unclassified Undibacterium TaxID=2630295 RepID=UPI002AC9C336|nr:MULTISPECIES: cytochrome c oxidase accessory protein CcoG [unclassified Undibacterium]MEB0139344.1 cytochrome c oxidase accessory protein CcoG [Undibacterium sp. CCC2.1]MEB0172188.1 cytochrome c oxidase accessory protein CcoG [Undibacterium sp. CCC1.1]MEB0176022.1 cytochrome c oxidase accessory protein CcoG [Undibacterium sp. CCC3.4]MEB0215334.1 cytochrome c oxidase accessory protein CcoG [Undibacterium sp. 5I2]WPX43410.1 cytochrome c oxidase accessory protein CcoG [Undibacterium sp. CCC3.4
MKHIPIIPVPLDEVDLALFEERKKIYPRSQKGWFASWRWVLVVITQLMFYGTVWLNWNDRQAVLFDLVTRKFYIFGIVFWPQDFIYLAVLLVISALSLFLFTAVAGRLFCGYACPQTVYTQIFLWVEQRVEGDRNARIKLDAGPLTARKFSLKFIKHFIWLAIALWTGFSFVGYFTPIRQLTLEVAGLTLGPWETFWLLFYGFATYGNAGWMREQVCKYMCPYARFQSAMFDKDTLIVTYDSERGEPRGSRNKKVDFKAAGLGACVDCGICVQVCPTGIDIRNGLQYECIACGLCIDGCDQVMDKMGYERGLIRYTTEHALVGKLDKQAMWQRVFRLRTLIYAAILGLIILASAVSLYYHVPLKVDVIRDRGQPRITEAGEIENVYRLQVMNTQESPRRYSVRVLGVPGAVILNNADIDVKSATARAMPVRVRVPPNVLQIGSNRIRFVIQDLDAEDVSVTEKAVFIVPR